MFDSLLFPIVVLILFLAFCFFWMASTIEYFDAKEREQKLSEDIVLALTNSQPTLQQVLQIAASRNVNSHRVYWILQALMRDILTGKHSDLAPHKETVEDYIEKMKELEPFEGMPNEIRIHLERLRNHLPNSPHLLEPLTSQIRELLYVNEKERRHQKYYTVGGFLLSIVGFLFAGYAYFYPYQEEPPMPAQSLVTPEVVK